MKKLLLITILLLGVVSISACGSVNQKVDGSVTEESDNMDSEIDSEDEKNVEKDSQEAEALSAISLKEQGNPVSINLADIAELTDDGANAWIKISTQYDEELSMYSYDSLPLGTQAIVATFKVTDFDCGESTIYWCYQLKSNGVETSLWDNTSPTDQLTITEDGTYTLVFDGQAALGGTIDEILSFQMVFPCGSDSTNTKVEMLNVECITDLDEMTFYNTGKSE